MIWKEKESKGLFGQTSELAFVKQSAYQKSDGNTYWCAHWKIKKHAKEKCSVLHPYLEPLKMKDTENTMFATIAIEDDSVRESNF